MQGLLRRIQFGINESNKYAKHFHWAFKAGTLVYANIVMWMGDNEAAILWFVVFLVLCKFDPKE